ncbi:hypothetical protein FGG08_006104 [Glutinoglossum americanum]|uniref:DUF6314 domain-containing protein n=1 Tax=Glutinoglossum americanum TaxID=1670608 RepID=A0A9P8I822_9PEZI|nr:hypothetical protein FGG08_006104 [Glutinoglossum americanum]
MPAFSCSIPTDHIDVLGGGPSGLVAAKTLLYSHPPGTFEPIIFEASSSVGGMWPLTVDDDRPHTVYGRMPTNLSKYTVSVSDFAWGSANLGGQKGGDGVPMFPKAWQVGRYLAAYAKEYKVEGCVRLGCKVTGAIRGTFEGGRRWRVKWEEKGDGESAFGESKSASDDFHFLIVASGFFSKRFEPEIEGLDDRVREKILVAHTAEVKDTGDLLGAIEEKARSAEGGPDNTVDGGTPRKIVVVGGSMSGAEAAASLALRLSDKKYSPPPPSGKREPGDYLVYHVTSRPFWALPPIIPSDPVVLPAPEHSEKASTLNPAPTFLPLDLCIYDLSRRPLGEITELSPVMPSERARSANCYFYSLVGGDHSGLPPDALAVRGEMAERPPWVAISEGYVGFVRDGAISVRFGRAEQVRVGESSGRASVVLSGGDTLENVVALVLATGYTPRPSLEFLEPEVLKVLGYQADDNFLPLLLEKHNTIHPSLLDLGFVGFYRGPYWGVIEMQARFLGKLWARGADSNAMSLVSPSPEESIEIQTMEALRNLEVGRGQWSMGDYVGLMEEFARDLGISRQEANSGPGSERRGPVVPARYALDTTSLQVQATLSSLSQTLQSAAAKPPSFVARATSAALQGTWRLSRALKSRISSFPSGTFTGTASFHSRLPTGEGFDAEYLYIEDGELVTDEGLRMRGSRRYVWRYEEEEDKLSVWFVKTNDGMSVDYFFHELEFCGRSEGRGGGGGGGDGFDEGVEEGGWIAIGHHLCEKDDYSSRYKFVFAGTAVRKFGVRYQVVGPKKDYFTETWYTR